MERQVFTTEAAQRIYTLLRGVPRRINNLCDICLLIGWTRRLAVITEAVVNGAAGARFRPGGGRWSVKDSDK